MFILKVPEPFTYIEKVNSLPARAVAREPYNTLSLLDTFKVSAVSVPLGAIVVFAVTVKAVPNLVQKPLSNCSE